MSASIGSPPFTHKPYKGPTPMSSHTVFALPSCDARAYISAHSYTLIGVIVAHCTAVQELDDEVNVDNGVWWDMGPGFAVLDSWLPFGCERSPRG
ncbi:uncharacterized protein ARMOST_08694 [Armillaria ostoyae]|uniref:Uncharacterized protein n=1 Tax=Armillaria ostoyae TaxID=47428 RepID=A0A284R9C9_ARMOS|nr:uncharacterized protein ARMOST_08694 [Armillaria ostoyae]